MATTNKPGGEEENGDMPDGKQIRQERLWLNRLRLDFQPRENLIEETVQEYMQQIFCPARANWKNTFTCVPPLSNAAVYFVSRCSCAVSF